MKTAIIDLAYLLSAVLFVFGLKRMQSPVTARTGNALASLGMLVAVVATLFLQDILSWPLILGGLALWLLTDIGLIVPLALIAGGIALLVVPGLLFEFAELFGYSSR